MKIVRNLVVLGAALACAAWGQDNRASMGGRVIDQQNAVIPGAQVLVKSIETRTEQKTTANGVGEWKILFLNPGHYDIIVSSQGFKTSERHEIELQTGDVKQIDISMTL